jgi:hypothetical protein
MATLQPENRHSVNNLIIEKGCRTELNSPPAPPFFYPVESGGAVLSGAWDCVCSCWVKHRETGALVGADDHGPDDNKPTIGRQVLRRSSDGIADLNF